MNIGVAYENGRIAKNLGDCREVLIITTEGREPVGKRIAGIAGTSATDLIKFAGLEQIDVLICGSLGLATRNALEMLGVLLVPGCEGSAEESVAKFLVGEKQGDPTILEIGREEDPDDPMACMHDCATYALPQSSQLFAYRGIPAAARASCSSRFRSRKSSKTIKTTEIRWFLWF